MIRRLSLLLMMLVLAACALSVAEQPTPIPIPTSTLALLPTPTAQIESSTPTDTAQTVATDTPADLPIALDDPAQLAAAVPGERDQVTLAEAFKGIGDIPDVARTEPLGVKVGDIEKFWVSDNINDSNYTVTAKLRYAGPIVLMYVDTEVEGDIEQEDIERSAKEFEERIYLRNRELFGEELSPGIDGDPRLTILNTDVRGAGGYFSSADGVVKAVNRFSNEREMFVIGIDSYPLGTPGYASTLAHEFQHMIEWHQARRSPSWFNEGMSTLAEDLNEYVDHRTAELYLMNPD